MKFKQLVPLLLIFVLPVKAYSQTQLPSFFSENMVLQQNENVAIWGTDTPNTEVTVHSSWGESVTTTARSHGKWKVYIPTPAVDNKNHRITVTGTKKEVIDNVMLGEVWFASGICGAMSFHSILYRLPPKVTVKSIPLC